MILLEKKINFNSNNDTSVNAREATHPLKYDLEDISLQEMQEEISDTIKGLQNKYPEYQDFYYKEVWDGRATWHDLYGIKKGE